MVWKKYIRNDLRRDTGTLQGTDKNVENDKEEDTDEPGSYGGD